MEEAPELVTAQLLDVGVLATTATTIWSSHSPSMASQIIGPCFLRNLRHKNNGSKRK